MHCRILASKILEYAVPSTGFLEKLISDLWVRRLGIGFLSESLAMARRAAYLAQSRCRIEALHFKVRD